MVRRYRPDPVGDDAVERVVSAGLSAPSAGFSQGQCFVVVTEPQRRRVIADLAGEGSYVARGFEPWLSVAPVHVALCTDVKRYEHRYSLPDKSQSVDPEQWNVPYWWLDAGASMMAILVAAVNEGLDAGFLGAHAIPGLSEALGLPEGVECAGIVTLGYGLESGPTESILQGRRDRSETVHWQRWSEPSRSVPNAPGMM
jgi:nitroreductase